MATATFPKHIIDDPEIDDSMAADSTFVMEKAEKPPAGVNTSGSKLNASLRRIADVAKQRALNNSVYRRRLKDNNTALARSLSLAKEEVKFLRNKVTRQRMENQELKRQLSAVDNDALIDEAVREEVKVRILDILAEVEDEYGDMNRRFALCTERIRQNMQQTMQDVSNLMGECNQPMASLGQLIKRRIDEAGDFVDDAAAETAPARKTMGGARRKTRVEPELMPEVQEEIREDRTEAVRRKTVTPLVMDKIEEAAEASDNGHEKDETPKDFAEVVKEVKSLVVPAPDTGPLAQNSTSGATTGSRRTIAIGREPEQPNVEVVTKQSSTRRKTVASKTVNPTLKTETETERKMPPRKSMAPMARPADDTVWEPPPAEDNRRKTVGSRRKEASKVEDSGKKEDGGPKPVKKGDAEAKAAKTKDVETEPVEKADAEADPKIQDIDEGTKRKKATRKTVHYKEAIAEVKEEDGFEGETVKIQPRPKSKRKAATNRSIARTDQLSESSESTGSQESENVRPRRHTAVASYKEPPLNCKLRRQK